MPPCVTSQGELPGATAAIHVPPTPSGSPRTKIMGIDGFAMAYQPFVDLRTRRITGFEALLRLPCGSSFKSVEGFIRAAENFGLVVPLDLNISGHVAGVVSAGHYATQPKIAVNLSGRSLDTGEFRNKLWRRFERWTDSGTKLNFEVTETCAIRDLPAVRALLAGLLACGADVAIDDFGKNETDETYLKSLAFNTVKIDGSRVQQAKTPAGRKALARLLSRLRPYNVKVIAEMIDDQSLVEILRDLGVDLGQGYFFQKPTTDTSILERQDEVIWPM